jgi:diguanylate cyclase
MSTQPAGPTGIEEDEQVPTRAFAILPTERHQRLRMRRCLLAGAGAVFLTGVCVLLFELGKVRMSTAEFLTALTVLWSVNFLFLFAIRSGWNRKFTDPSLTLPQLGWGIFCLIFFSYFLDDLRSSLLFITLMALVFGTFQLSLARLTLVSTICCLGYGLVTYLIINDPSRQVDATHEVVQWAAFSVVAYGFAWLGGEVHRIRRSLRERNASLRTAVESLRSQSITDELTGVHNRRYMLQLLHQHKDHTDRGGPGFSVGIADLDSFKSINDRFGHGLGDVVLKTFADMASNRLRAFDSFARYGGEEFVFLVSDAARDGAVTVAERLREALAAHRFEELGPEVQVTVSIGISQYQADEDIDRTLQRADKALYHAKDNGRNRVEVT